MGITRKICEKNYGEVINLAIKHFDGLYGTIPERKKINRNGVHFRVTLRNNVYNDGTPKKAGYIDGVQVYRDGSWRPVFFASSYDFIANEVLQFAEAGVCGVEYCKKNYRDVIDFVIKNFNALRGRYHIVCLILNHRDLDGIPYMDAILFECFADTISWRPVYQAYYLNNKRTVEEIYEMMK